MTLALRSPELVHNIVSVDNAPLDAALLSNFGKYIQGMKKVEDARVTRQAEADRILQDYEEVTSRASQTSGSNLTSSTVFNNQAISPRQSVSFAR